MPIKIVVTDGHALNSGDLDWGPISSLGDCIVYDRTAAVDILERCKHAEIVLSNKTPFSAETLKALPELKYISVLATGYNVIDIEAAREQGVLVSNTPGYGTDSVAQHVFSMLLELTNHVAIEAAATAKGKWQESADWCFTEAPVTELAGKTIGIVGFGDIGQQVARIATAFGMQVLYSGPNDKKTDLAKFVSIEDLFAQSDVVTLHSPLTADNKEFVNRALLEKMKKSAILINTARGQLINEQDLTDALNSGVIKAAALDVLSKEPPPGSNPLLKARNCVITPHVAWISIEARQRIMDITLQNIRAYLDGKAVNVVN